MRRSSLPRRPTRTISTRINLFSDTDVINSGSGTLELTGYIGNPFGKTLTTQGNVMIAGTAAFAAGSNLSVDGGTAASCLRMSVRTRTSRLERT